MALKRGSKAYQYADKAQQAMLAAVEIYNSPLITFKSEVCITLITLAWTYLLQSYCKKQHIDTKQYERSKKRKRYKRGKNGEILEQPLGELLNMCGEFVSLGAKNNIEFLIGVRNHIQHSAGSSVDPIIAPKIQANVLDFRVLLNEYSDSKFDIGRKLPLALQFAELSLNQTKKLLTAANANPLLSSFILDFEEHLSPEERTDTQYEAHIKFELENKNHSEDLLAMKIIKLGDEIPENATIIANKEVEKPKYLPGEIVNMMRLEGYKDFSTYWHTKLWQSRNARRSGTGFCYRQSGQWFWYEKWINEVVRPYCADHWPCTNTTRPHE